jgi:hypothetical protein
MRKILFYFLSVWLSLPLMSVGGGGEAAGLGRKKNRQVLGVSRLVVLTSVAQRQRK